jgi:spermidine synthase
VLVIGGAGNALALNLEREGHQVDTVEIDPAVVRLSADWFGRTARDPIISDGRVYVSNYRGAPYDIVIMDAFCGPAQIPVHMTTVEWFWQVRSVLAEGGLLIFNSIGALSGDLSEAPNTLCDSMASAFPYRYVIPSVDKEAGSAMAQNILLVASNRPYSLIGTPCGDHGLPLSTDDRSTMDLIMLRVYQKAFKYFSVHETPHIRK